MVTQESRSKIAPDITDINYTVDAGNFAQTFLSMIHKEFTEILVTRRKMSQGGGANIMTGRKSDYDRSESTGPWLVCILPEELYLKYDLQAIRDFLTGEIVKYYLGNGEQDWRPPETTGEDYHAF